MTCFKENWNSKLAHEAKLSLKSHQVNSYQVIIFYALFQINMYVIFKKYFPVVNRKAEIIQSMTSIFFDISFGHLFKAEIENVVKIFVE